MVGRGREKWRKHRDEERANRARKRWNPGQSTERIGELKKKKKKQKGTSRERTQEEVPVTNCGLIVREIAPAACCALLLLLMLPSVLHVVSSTLRQPPGVLKILIPLKIGPSLRLRSVSGDGIIVLRGWIYVGDFWPVRNCN